MEVFCRNVPAQIKDNHLKQEFKPVLKQFGIDTFHCRKAGARNAKVTILDAEKAQRVLDRHGQDDQRRRRPAQLLRMFGGPIYLSKARDEPDDFLLRSLRDEREDPHRLEQKQIEEVSAEHRRTSFFVADTSCGLFEYLPNGKPVLVDCFRLTLPGRAVFGKTALRVYLTDSPRETDYQIEFDYWNVMGDTIYLGGREKPSITITGAVAPRLYVSNAEDKLAQKMKALFDPKSKPAPPKRRVGSLSGEHREVAGTCFTYRFLLKNADDIFLVRKLGGTARHMPTMNRWVDARAPLSKPYPEILNHCLVLIASAEIPYIVKFQLQRLMWNGDLSPSNAIRFYHSVIRLLPREGPDAVALGIKRMASKVQYPSPDTDHADVGAHALLQMLQECIDGASRDLETGVETKIGSSNSISIHQAQVTPCGTYLYGPSAETKNRVLRQYAGYIEYFLRVLFVDENGDRVHFDPNASLDDIFYQRFKNVLMSGISIGGRTFEFLGFSHSSLRSQTCWFVAPFETLSGEYVTARTIISRLGSFQGIRLPAKLAARIGQAFSDTLTSIPVNRHWVAMDAPDVSRNGRVFSDGVGTISPKLMYKIWEEYALREKVKPTVFQIRIAGKCRFLRLLGLFPLLKSSCRERLQRTINV